MMFFTRLDGAIRRGFRMIALPLAVAVCAFLGASTAWGSTVLIHDTFSDGNIATFDAGAGEVNGGFQLIHNANQGTPTLSESGGLGRVQNPTASSGQPGSSANAGFVSIHTFGSSDAPNGLHLRFVVDSMTSRPSQNGMRLGIKTEGSTFPNTNTVKYFWLSLYGPNNPISQVRIGAQDTQNMPTMPNVFQNLYTSSGSANNFYTGANNTQSSVPWLDGFEADIWITPTGWSYQVVGLNNNENSAGGGTPVTFTQSGFWSAMAQTGPFAEFNYADFFDGNFSVFSTVHQSIVLTPQSTGSITHRYDQITVTALPIPEPATCTLLGGCLAALAAFRRRRAT